MSWKPPRLMDKAERPMEWGRRFVGSRFSASAIAATHEEHYYGVANK